jgi:HlyD family secretion protein
MKRWLKITIGITVVLVIVAVVLWRRVANDEAEVKTQVVERHTVVQEVTFTGRLRSKERAAIAFESSGTLREISVELGDKVVAGQTLAKLDPRASSLEAAKARADQAAAAKKSYIAWQDAQDAAGATVTENSHVLETRRQTVRDAKLEMDQVQEVWQQSVRESGDESSTAKARYATFLTAQSAYRAAQKSLAQSQATVDKTNQAAQAAAEEARSVYIATQQAAAGVAGLSSGQALEALANLRLAKTVAVAPFDGMVTTKSFQAGELATAGQVVVTVESTDTMEVVADVPESDITKLKQDQDAVFTLDAFADGREVRARIVSIAPAAKVLEGVPTYEVLLSLDRQDDLRPGMTANVTVQTARKENVIAIPRRAIVRTGGVSKVKVVDGDAESEKQVKVGVLGTDGFMEIVSGLNEGEVIVVSSTTGDGTN